MTNTPLTALLYEHEDGRYAVNPDTTGDPGWHRLGPVDLGALAAQGQEAEPRADVYVEITHQDSEIHTEISMTSARFDALPPGVAALYLHPPRAQADAPAAPAVAPQDVADALLWVDDFIARCNGDDRGACESVEILRRALAQAAPAALATPDERAAFDAWFIQANGFDPRTDTTMRSDAWEPWKAWKARAALAAAPQAPAETQEPYCWHYWNNGGTSVYHRGPSKMLDADRAAAAEYPKVHHCIPLYTHPAPQQAAPQAPAAPVEMSGSFVEWFTQNYPSDTIIVDPAWHAQSIFRMAQAHARLSAVAAPAAPAVDVGDTLSRVPPQSYFDERAALALLVPRALALADMVDARQAAIAAQAAKGAA